MGIEGGSSKILEYLSAGHKIHVIVTTDVYIVGHYSNCCTYNSNSSISYEKPMQWDIITLLQDVEMAAQREQISGPGLNPGHLAPDTVLLPPRPESNLKTQTR